MVKNFSSKIWNETMVPIFTTSISHSTESTSHTIQTRKIKEKNNHHSLQMIWCYISVPLSSVTQSCPTLCDPMNCSTPGLPVHHQLPEFTQTHVHWVGDAIQPSHPLSSPSPPALNLSQHQALFQWVGSSHQVGVLTLTFILYCTLSGQVTLFPCLPPYFPPSPSLFLSFLLPLR